MAEQTKKFLVAVDGSKRALATVRYIAGTLAPGAAEITLFSVLETVPAPYWDLHNDPAFASRLSGVRGWALEQERRLDAFLDKATAMLVKAGHSKESVVRRLKERRSGAATDILAEAAMGYDTVAFGRRGLGAIRGILLGSVAARLAAGLTTTPLWVIGKDAKPPRMLITLDGSQNSLRAVDYAAGMCQGRDLNFTLLHVYRDEQLVFAHKRDQREAAQRLLDQGKRRLTNTGVDPDRVKTRLVEDALSRAGAVVQVAREGHYGTIVMGRKGVTDNSQFPMGRVTQKVLMSARGLAVWIIP